MMIPVIPTTEVQLAIVQIDAEGTRKAVTLSDSHEIPATKNAGGMHLVLRHVVQVGASANDSQSAIRVRFAKDPPLDTVFLSRCDNFEFLDNGILLSPGEHVCLELKPSIGIQPGTKFRLPYALSIEVPPTRRQSGRPDEPVILIQC